MEGGKKKRQNPNQTIKQKNNNNKNLLVNEENPAIQEIWENYVPPSQPACLA